MEVVIEARQIGVTGLMSTACRRIGAGGAILLLMMIGACSTDPQHPVPSAEPEHPVPSVATPIPAAILSMPPYEIYPLANGTELELAGGMPVGTTDAVAKQLDAMPGIHVLHLNSEGGIVLEGYRLAGLIKARALVTYTSTTCASACTIAFLAGKQRYLGKNGWLAFHGTTQSFGGETSAIGNEAMRRMYREEGLSDGFIDKVLATAPRDLWYPTHDQLIAAHAIDAVVDETRFARSGLAHWQNAEQLDAIMKQNVLYAALADHDANNYGHIRAIFLSGAKAGKSIAEMRDDVSSYVGRSVLPIYLMTAPDKPLLRYWRSQVAEFEFLEEIDPQACAALAFPKLGLPSPAVEHLLPAALLREDSASLADLIAQTTGDQQPVATPAMMKMNVGKMVTAAQQESPDTVRAFINPRAFIDSPATICKASLFFFKSMLDLPVDDTASMLRAIMVAK